MERNALMHHRMAVLAVGLAVALGAAPAAAQVRIRAFLSTGDEIAGPVISGTPTLVRVQDEQLRRTVIVYMANVLEMELTLSQAVGAPVDGDASDLDRQVQTARFLLGRRLGGLAQRVLVDAMDSVGDDDEARARFRQEAVGVYQQARLPVPAVFAQDEPPGRRYAVPTVEAVRANLAQAERLGAAMARIAPQTHRIDTPHFRIYSSWHPSDDRALTEIYERLYTEFCRQFDIPEGENIWIGRLPVFAFWEAEHYQRFLLEVLGAEEHMARNTAGIVGRRGDFLHVTLGPVQQAWMTRPQARQWFFELLSHETTHAFLWRFLGDGDIPSWLNEGLAEVMASTLVPNSQAMRKLTMAHQAMRTVDPPDIEAILAARHVPLEPAAYGAVHSMARFLLRHDRQAVLRMIELIKEGKSDVEAMQEAFGWTREEFIERWRRAIR